MRSTADRIRQAVAFEMIGLVLVTPLGAWAFGLHAGTLGVLAAIGATVATVWNYVYNLAFDRTLRRIRGREEKTVALRVIHALAFEGGLLVVLVPLFAWWLGVSLVTALAMDLAFSAFYAAYAFVFTWAYDTLFPARERAAAAGA